MESNNNRRKSCVNEDANIKVVASSPVLGLSEIVLRLLAVATTLAAAVVMGTDKETETVEVNISPKLPPLPISVTAKSTTSSAFLYFIIANAIACAYSAILFIMSITRRACREKLVFPISAVDLLVIALLFSGNGAALAIGFVGRNGDKHAGWNKICNVYGVFCAKVLISITISTLGSLAYLFLVSLNIFILHRRSA